MIMGLVVCTFQLHLVTFVALEQLSYFTSYHIYFLIFYRLKSKQEVSCSHEAAINETIPGMRV